jgi:hypothetical protein
MGARQRAPVSLGATHMANPRYTTLFAGRIVRAAARPIGGTYKLTETGDVFEHYGPRLRFLTIDGRKVRVQFLKALYSMS